MIRIIKPQELISKLNTNIQDLFKINKTRANQILEIGYYGVIYTVLSYYIGHFLNDMFPKLERSKKNIDIFIEIMIQGIVTALSVFYLRKLATLIPIPVTFGRIYEKNRTQEYYGEIIIAVVFVATQTKIIEKIEYLKNYNKLY